jgi:Tfp pilus tip-associated adhesin PilY1
MNRPPWFTILRTLLLFCAVYASLLSVHANAAVVAGTADISSIPLGTRSATNVPPNLMFILDDSGSMASDFMPDNANDNICKQCSGAGCAPSMTGGACEAGTPPFYSPQFNTIYYNPNVVYKPGVDYLNITLGNQSPTAARNDPYNTGNTSTKNLVNTYTDIYWCTTGAPADVTDTAVCQRNGINTGNPFGYTLTSGLPNATFRNRVVVNSLNPHYYIITPREYCTDETLITCTLSTAPTSVGAVSYNFPAPMRWCRSAAAANAATAVSGGAPRDCQALIDGTYRFPRHGNYTRVDIRPATTTYPKATTRSDCAGAVGPTGCSYTEELQNFANWFSYYRSRILMMKTVPGRVFASIGNDPNAGAIRVGFVTINASSNARYLKIDDFKLNTHRQNWFTKLYSITTGSSTPLREALSRVGRHFAGITSGINSFMPDEPMTASCQRNYALLTTDGYWNGNAGQNLTGSAIGDQDDVPSATPPTYVDRSSTVTLDGVGTTVTTVTPTTAIEQAICTGAGNATFSGPTTRACGCSGSDTRIVQRTRTFNSTVVAIDNVAGAPTNGTFTDAYTNITPCTTALILTAVTPTTIVEQQVLTANANSTFPAVNGVTAGANQAGVCATGQRRIKERTTTFNTTVTTTNGVAGAPVISGTTYAFTNPGTCASVATTVVTPVTVVDEQVVTGAANSTFSAIGGITGGANEAGVCTGGQRRVKRRTTTYNSTVITTDGVVGAATISGVAYAFTNPGTCASVVQTADTPVTVVEQQVLTGAAASTFGVIGGITASANQAGVCTGGQRRIKQRTTNYTSRVVTTDGVAAAPVIVGVGYAFTDPGTCASVVQTADTPVTVVEQQVLTGAANSTFGPIGGITAGANQAGVCTGGQRRIKQRTTNYTSRVVTTDGVAAAPVILGVAYAFTNPGTCASVVTTADTPVTVVEQQVLTGAAASTFGAIGGITAGANQAGVCTGGQRRIKQRTTNYTSRVVTTDGVAAAPVIVGVGYAFTDPGTCASVVQTADTPVTVVEQQVLTGAAASTFSAVGGITAGANQAGVCTGGQRRIKQRTTNYTSRVVTTDGVTAAPVIVGVGYGFADPGTCASIVTTNDTPVTIVEEQLLVANNASTFAPINGVAYTNNPGGCSALPAPGQAGIRRRTTTYTSRVVTTDGVTAAPALIGTSYVTLDLACVNLTSTVTNTVTETTQWVTTSNGTNRPTLFAAPQNSAASGNPQSTFTCASGTMLLQRVLGYNRVQATTNGSTTTTFGTTTSGPTFTTVQACSGSGKTAAGPNIVNGVAGAPVTSGAPVPAATTTTNGATTSGTVGAYPTAAATTTTNGAVSNTTTGAYPTAAATTTTNGAVSNTTTGAYPTAAATTTTNGATTNTTTGAYPTAAATTTTNGAVSSTTTGAYPTAAASTTVNGTPASTTTGAYPTAAASTTTSGVAVVTNNGGTTLTITLSPNPTITSAAPTVTTTAGGSPDTLADVAMYYYKNDLRTSGPFAKDNVPVSGKYIAPHQHMVTFTMGLGLDGLMTYRDDYETATEGDFFKIRTGSNTCIWTTGTCNWPVPVGDTPTAIDDLWHAAVNGRGKYFSAKVPVAAENGIKDTLAAVEISTGSAAAAATSTPNLTTTNNSLYRSTYRTVKWDGEITALTIDPATGVINPTPIWSAATQLNSQGAATTDTRTIYTFDGSAASKLKLFNAATLTPSELANFQNKCTVANWSQCSYLAGDATRLAAANNATNLVNYLRGQRGNELSTDTSTGYFRARDFLLGDTVSAKPAFMGAPEQQYGDAGYSTFATTPANVTRTKLLFVGANDGMLHALNATTGAEQWAYIPKMVLPNLYRLADASYGSKHAYYVDGSPTLTDAFIGGAWKTVLVGGLNSGGRGYYALDVTDPSNPKALWEICADPALCGITDSDMGLSFGQPVIGKRPSDGKWVALVTSGYNNIGPGNGGGYLYMLDLATGVVLEKVATAISGTNVGDSTTPSGFAKIAGYATNFITDNTITLVYGGDLLGNMWRFDLATSPPTVKRIAQLKDSGGKPQSVTTRPEITRFDAGFNAVYVGTGRFIGVSDVPDPATLPTPLPFAYQQTVYAFKDTDADLGDLRSANLVKQSITVIDAATRGISNDAVNWTTNNGWYVDFNPVCTGGTCSAAGESPGERVNLDLQLVRGTLVVITNEPNSDTCTAGGDSFLYQFNYASGSFVPTSPGGVVGTKIGNTLAVGIVIVQPTSGQLTGIITTASGGLPQVPVTATKSTDQPRRAAWRELLTTE